MDKLGTNFDTSLLKSPLTVGKPSAEKGPAVANTPIISPADPLGFLPGNSKKAK